MPQRRLRSVPMEADALDKLQPFFAAIQSLNSCRDLVRAHWAACLVSQLRNHLSRGQLASPMAKDRSRTEHQQTTTLKGHLNFSRRPLSLLLQMRRTQRPAKVPLSLRPAPSCRQHYEERYCRAVDRVPTRSMQLADSSTPSLSSSPSIPVRFPTTNWLRPICLPSRLPYYDLHRVAPARPPHSATCQQHHDCCQSNSRCHRHLSHLWPSTLASLVARWACLRPATATTSPRAFFTRRLERRSWSRQCSACRLLRGPPMATLLRCRLLP